MRNVISLMEVRENKEKYFTGIQLDKIMKRLFTLQNKRPLIDFLNAIYKDNLSLDSEVKYTGTESTDKDLVNNFIFKSNYCDIKLEVIDVERVFKYIIEFQTIHDESIAIRMFKYSLNLEVQGLDFNDDGVIVIDLPKPYVIVLEESDKVPENYKVILRSNDGEFTYNCKALKYWEYDLDRLEKENMYLLLPVKVFSLRKRCRALKLRKSKTKIYYKLIEELRNDILKLIREILEHIDHIYKEEKITINEYNEFTVIIQNLSIYLNEELDNEIINIEEEVKTMVETFYNPEIEKRGILKGRQQGIDTAKREDAKNFIKLGIDLEIVSKGTGLDKEIIDEIYNEVLKESN